jgi:hypothetical protein
MPLRLLAGQSVASWAPRDLADALRARAEGGGGIGK